MIWIQRNTAHRTQAEWDFGMQTEGENSFSTHSKGVYTLSFWSSTFQWPSFSPSPQPLKFLHLSLTFYLSANGISSHSESIKHLLSAELGTGIYPSVRGFGNIFRTRHSHNTLGNEETGMFRLQTNSNFKALLREGRDWTYSAVLFQSQTLMLQATLPRTQP